jgi:hypothetical protein
LPETRVLNPSPSLMCTSGLQGALIGVVGVVCLGQYTPRSSLRLDGTSRWHSVSVWSPELPWVGRFMSSDEGFIRVHVRGPSPRARSAALVWAGVDPNVTPGDCTPSRSRPGARGKRRHMGGRQRMVLLVKSGVLVARRGHLAYWAVARGASRLGGDVLASYSHTGRADFPCLIAARAAGLFVALAVGYLWVAVWPLGSWASLLSATPAVDGLTTRVHADGAAALHWADAGCWAATKAAS